MEDSFVDFEDKYWINLKKDLKKIVGSTAYNNWLKHLNYISLENDIIYAGIKNKIYAMSVNDGKTLWDKDVTGRILSSITIGPKSLYVTTDDNKVFSLSKDGTINWTIDIKGDLAAPPVVDNTDIVFIGDASKKVYRINGTSGEIEWTQKVPGKVVTNIIIDADGTLYGGTDSGGIVAIADKETHENIENLFKNSIFSNISTNKSFRTTFDQLCEIFEFLEYNFDKPWSPSTL